MHAEIQELVEGGGGHVPIMAQAHDDRWEPSYAGCAAEGAAAARRRRWADYSMG